MKKCLLLFFALFISQTFLSAQVNLNYQKPPKEIMDLVDYERAPSVTMDTKKEYMVLSYRNTYKTLDDLNQEELHLAGLRINPITNISVSESYINNLKIRKISEKEEKQVQGLPSAPKISNIKWAPDEKKIAFTNTTARGVELWLVDIASAQAIKLTEANLNANLDDPFIWFRNSESILVKALPKNRPAIINYKNEIPTGPTISVSDGSKSQNVTYQDLLKNRADEDNFENIASSELYKVSLAGKIEFYKEKAMYVETEFSPNGAYLMITTLQKPFSYVVPFERFPMKTIVFDSNGKEIKVVNEIPLTESLPKGAMAVRQGKRSMDWRADKPATLYFAMALDKGDPKITAAYRDEIFSWSAPFSSEPVSIAKTVNRFAGITWGNDEIAILYDRWYDTRNAKTYIFNPTDASSAPKVITDRNYQDVYSDPGAFETEKNEFGKRVLAIAKDKAFLIGAGYSKEGQFPFIDEFSLKTLKTNRIYQSTYTDKLENLISIIDFNKREALVRIQSKNEFPNYYFRNIKKDKLTQITFFKNPFESMAGVSKQIIKYKRQDGVELSGTLYLPANYDTVKKEKLPLLIWAYPAEFKDKASAGAVKSNPNEFTYPYYGSFVYWAVRGYAVLDDAAFPIIGEGKAEPNDTFLKQLVDNASAAIDAVDAMGYIDRKKVGVGGHSYGAFMTANLLTHSNLFACGVARSGAYNRTLTPFGFQNEQRNYWDAQDVYNTMSPFMSADKMKTPLLLVHGDADNNPGTFTLQTERYFQALKGLGAPVRMVLLPKEAHSYVAKENIMHLLWEQDQFFEKYLKNK